VKAATARWTMYWSVHQFQRPTIGGEEKVEVIAPGNGIKVVPAADLDQTGTRTFC
jgi:hypothetical protein